MSRRATIARRGPATWFALVWIPLAALSCFTDFTGPARSGTSDASEPTLDPFAPPRWAADGEEPKRMEPRTGTSDPRLDEYRTETPLKYGYPGHARLARFLFVFDESPGRSVEESVAEAFDLPLEAARLAVGAMFSQTKAWNESIDGTVSSSSEEAERAYQEAIELAPDRWVLYEALGELYSDSPHRCDMQGLDRLADRWGERLEALVQLAPIVIGNSECNDFYHLLLAEAPDDFEVLGLLGRHYDSNTFRSGFGLAIRRYALELASQRNAPAGLQRTIERGLIHALLSTGRAREALVLWEAHSPEEQARLLEPPNAYEDVFPSGFRGINAPIDMALKLELAAVYAAEGKDDRARALMPPASSIPPIIDDEPLIHGHSTPSGCHQLLRVALGEPLDDPFEYLLKLAGAGGTFSDLPDTCHHNQTFTRLSRRIAREAGYPQLVSAFDRADDPFQARDFEYFEEHDAEFLENVTASLREHYAAVRREFEVGDAPDPSQEISDEVRQLVAARFESPFVESAAAEAPPAAPPSRSVVTWIETAARPEQEAPSDVARTDRLGDLVARVHLNPDVDPMGEVGAGGYWLSFSADGGRTWTRRLYTGLRAHFPYVVEFEHSLPILSGDVVQLAAEIEEIDTSTISFPPIGLGTKRHERGRVLTTSLESLSRDSDGDGLSDLLERALLLDPVDADSDGDGLPDGFDPLPRTPYREDTSARSQALRTAIPHLFGSGLHARVVAPLRAEDFEGDGLERAMGTPVEAGSERTLIVVADNDDFAGITVAGRVVVLSWQEARAIRERLGVFYPTSIGLFILDHEERRGYLGWGGGWTGGALGFKRSFFGGWVVEVLSHWMT